MPLTSQLIYDQLSGVPTCHASTIVELPNGVFAAAWFGGERESSPDSGHYWAKLRPGEDKWDEPACLWNVPEHSAGNPRFFMGAQDRLWAMLPVNYGAWCNGGTRFYFRTSDDLGDTWSEPVWVSTLDGLLGKNKPVVFPDCKFVLPVTNEIDKTSAAVIYDPAADAWDVSAEIARADGRRCIQPAFVELADGSLLGYMRTDDGFVWRSTCRDGGQMWSEPKRTKVPNNDSGLDLARLANGHLVLAFNNTSERGTRNPLTVAVSTDDGETWPRMIDLETDQAEYSYPAVIVAADQTIHVTYTHRRRHISHATLTEDDVVGA